MRAQLEECISDAECALHEVDMDRETASTQVCFRRRETLADLQEGARP